MSRKVDRWAAKNGLNLEFIGVDMNPGGPRCEGSDRAGPAAPMGEGRPLRLPPRGRHRHIMSSLFTHHLPDPQLIRFIRWMEENARIGWFINDIERHPLPYYFLKFVFWATRRHRFIRHDGPVSVASAFKKEDWARLLKEAGLREGAARVEPWTPFRLCVSRVKETP